jgi:hypothetical protein
MELHKKWKHVADVLCDHLRVPPRVKRGGGSAVTLWQVLNSAMIAWVLPEVLVCLVWEYSFSFIPQGMLYLVFGILFTFRAHAHQPPSHFFLGHFQGKLGSPGTALGQFKFPTAIAATDDYVLVLDRSNERYRVCVYMLFGKIGPLIS